MTLGQGIKRIGNALLAAIFGGILAPIATFVVMLIVNGLNSVRGTPGDSGGRAMGAAGVAIAAIPFGAGIGLALGIYAGLTSS